MRVGAGGMGKTGCCRANNPAVNRLTYKRQHTEDSFSVLFLPGCHSIAQAVNHPTGRFYDISDTITIPTIPGVEVIPGTFSRRGSLCWLCHLAIGKETDL